MQNNENLKPIDVIKSAGLTDFEEFEYITEQSKQTLINWFNNPKKRKLFDCAVLGAAVMKSEQMRTPKGYWLWGYSRINRKYQENKELMSKKVIEFAEHCIERFPDSLGREDCTQEGTPRSVLNNESKIV